MLSAANRNAPEPQVGIENSDAFDRLPEGAQQIRAFAALDHVLGKLPDIEIERDEIIDLADFARRQFRPDFRIAGAPRHDFAPDLGGQAEVGRRLSGSIAFALKRPRCRLRSQAEAPDRTPCLTAV